MRESGQNPDKRLQQDGCSQVLIGELGTVDRLLKRIDIRNIKQEVESVIPCHLFRHRELTRQSAKIHTFTTKVTY
jgi:hypothetical protein